LQNVPPVFVFFYRWPLFFWLRDVAVITFKMSSYFSSNSKMSHFLHLIVNEICKWLDSAFISISQGVPRVFLELGLYFSRYVLHSGVVMISTVTSQHEGSRFNSQLFCVGFEKENELIHFSRYTKTFFTLWYIYFDETAFEICPICPIQLLKKSVVHIKDIYLYNSSDIFAMSILSNLNFQIMHHAVL